MTTGLAKKLGFDTSHYECGIHPPYDKEAREEARKLNIIYTPYYNNCSGKHSGMLSLAKKLNTNPEGYIHLDHPVQKAIFRQHMYIYKAVIVETKFVTA